MKKYFVLFVLIFFSITLDAASLDGTTNIVYESNHYIFSDGDSATGFVKLDNGFTMPENATVTFNVPYSISGGIDLRTTGILKLDGDLYLDSSVTLSSGGYIYGADKTIYLGGDLFIPDETDLIFCFSGVIDGNGHDLILGCWSQILIDSNVTLTLKNLTIKNSVNSLTRPPIRCLDWYSKFILDNVVFALNDDFYFNTGQLFIYNDVSFTGTSKFSYRSVLSSYIQPHSVLYFDHNTMFDYYPSSTRNDLINLIDDSSSIYLNGATLQTTDTGIKLTKGRLFLDNKVTLSGIANTQLYDLSISDSKNFGGRIMTIDLSPDGNYLVIGGGTPDSGDELQIYSFNNGILSSGPIISRNYGIEVRSVVWSPDGRFLAVGGQAPVGGNELQIYSFKNGVLSTVPVDSKNYGTYIISLDWTPDGKYLAIGGQYPDSGNELQIYSFDNGLLSTNPIASRNYGNYIFSLDFHPNGQSLAISGNGPASGGELQIYSFDNGTLSASPIETRNYGAYLLSLNWSLDGKYLAIGGGSPTGGNELQIYSFNNGSLSLLPVDSKNYGSFLYSVRWSSCGKYVSAGGNGSSSGDELQIYSFNNGSLSSNPICSKKYGTTIFVEYWIPYCEYLIIGGNGPINGNELQVYKNNYVLNSTSQTFNNSIIFGDSEKGSDYDLDVNILSGARVEVNGNVWDDSSS